MKRDLINLLGLSEDNGDVIVAGVHDELGDPAFQMDDEEFRLRLRLEMDGNNGDDPNGPMLDTFLQPLIMVDVLDIMTGASAGMCLDAGKTRLLIQGLQSLLDEGEALFQQMKDDDERGHP